MTKSYKKKKDIKQLGYRTPDHFKGEKFNPSKKSGAQAKFNPAMFKTQHKG